MDICYEAIKLWFHFTNAPKSRVADCHFRYRTSSGGINAKIMPLLEHHAFMPDWMQNTLKRTASNGFKVRSRNRAGARASVSRRFHRRRARLNLRASSCAEGALAYIAYIAAVAAAAASGGKEKEEENRPEGEGGREGGGGRQSPKEAWTRTGTDSS